MLTTLGVLAAGETANAEDAAVTDAAIDSLYGELGKYGGVSFALTAIDDWAQDAMRDAVAFRVAPSFGIPADRIAQLAAMFGAAWQLLTRQASALAAPSDTKADLIVKVLQRLNVLKPGEVTPAAHSQLVSDAITHVFAWYTQRGTLGFTATTIPDWAMRYLRDAVAHRCARECGISDVQQIAVLSQAHDLGIAELDKRMSALAESNTKYQLRNAILQHLGVIGLAEVATAAQKEMAESIIDRTFEQLKAHNVITFATTAIPTWAMMPLRNYIAYDAAPSFGAPPAMMPQLMADQRAAFSEMKAQQQTSNHNAVVKAVYY